jgi:hypothetical protein
VNATLRGVPLGIIGLRKSGAIDVRVKAEFATQRLEEEHPLRVVGV